MQAAHRRTVVAGAKGGPCVDLQRHAVVGNLALVMGSIDEEATGLDGRQARQAHGQPVGIGQLLDHHIQFALLSQDGRDALGFIFGRREGVDAPDTLILVLFQNRIGSPFQQGVFVDRGGRVFGGVTRAAGNDLDCGLGHFSNTVMIMIRQRGHGFARCNPGGRVHG